MGKHGAQAGAKNPFWKGGRVIASNGYVLLKMPGHHLADVRGYVVASIAHHRVHHRRPGGKALRLPDEPNPEIACACGCGTTFPRYDATGRPRRFVTGHNGRGA